MTEPDPVAAAARSAAAVLAPELGPHLPAHVEAALAARHAGQQRPGQYDPAALAGIGIAAASLIVSIAQLAWSIVSDHRQHTAPAPEAITRQVRIALREQDTALPDSTGHITDVVITEVIRRVDPPW